MTDNEVLNEAVERYHRAKGETRMREEAKRYADEFFSLLFDD